jgi:hypothetical protein
VPAYREVSASGKGIHIIFRFKDFNKLINDKFIWKVTDGLEIFVSGKTNKMLILTGYAINHITGSLIERKTYRTSRAKFNNRIVEATLPQLRSFLDVLSRYQKQHQDSVESKDVLLPTFNKTEIPKWVFIPFSKFDDKDLRSANPHFATPESKKGYTSALKDLKTLQDIILTNDFGSNKKYVSYSEVDYTVFTILVRLYLNSDFHVRDLSSIIQMCLNYYRKHFPIREEKADEYFVRTCYNSLMRTFKQRSCSSNLIQHQQLNLIKTPAGLLSEVNNFDEKQWSLLYYVVYKLLVVV